MRNSHFDNKLPVEIFHVFKHKCKVTSSCQWWIKIETKTSLKVLFSDLVTKSELFGAINVCVLLWTKFLAETDILILSTTSFNLALHSSCIVQQNKTYSIVSLSVLHCTCWRLRYTRSESIGNSAWCHWAEYASNTPTSHFLGQRILVPVTTSGINAYVHCVQKKTSPSLFFY